MDEQTKQALRLPFEAYMRWCHEFCAKKAATDPVFNDVYQTSVVQLEAGWARRYWLHQPTIRKGERT